MTMKIRGTRQQHRELQGQTGGWKQDMPILPYFTNTSRMSPESMWILREKLCNDEDLGAFFVKKRWIVTCSCPLS